MITSSLSPLWWSQVRTSSGIFFAYFFTSLSLIGDDFVFFGASEGVLEEEAWEEGLWADEISLWGISASVVSVREMNQELDQGEALDEWVCIMREDWWDDLERGARDQEDSEGWYDRWDPSCA